MITIIKKHPTRKKWTPRNCNSIAHNLKIIHNIKECETTQCWHHYKKWNIVLLNFIFIWNTQPMSLINRLHKSRVFCSLYNIVLCTKFIISFYKWFSIYCIFLVVLLLQYIILYIIFDGFGLEMGFDFSQLILRDLL